MYTFNLFLNSNTRTKNTSFHVPCTRAHKKIRIQKINRTFIFENLGIYIIKIEWWFDDVFSNETFAHKCTAPTKRARYGLKIYIPFSCITLKDKTCEFIPGTVESFSNTIKRFIYVPRCICFVLDLWAIYLQSKHCSEFTPFYLFLCL